jgi:hypothetical protein
LNLPSDLIKLWDITDEPPVELEIRVCILNAEDVPMMDAEGTSDVFYKGSFDQKDV